MIEKRYLSLSNISPSVIGDVDISIKEFGDYIVDDSQFLPMSEALKRLNGSRTLSDAEISQCYDFPDGKDTGFHIPIDRAHTYHGDIAELSHEVNSLSSDIDSSINDDVKIHNIRKKYNQNNSSMDSSVSTVVSSTTTSTT